MKSLKGLARKLCVPLEVLEELAEKIEFQYRTFPQTRNGKTRTITAPSERLKSVQGRIYSVLLKPRFVPAHIHGSVPRKSALTNAQVHAGQSWLTRIDIKSFFPSVTPHHVYKVWIRSLGCSPSVAKLLTRLTTYNFQLPQGTPTSPALANLVLAGVDDRILGLAKRTGFKYTRYVDDLGLSGDNPQDLVAPVAALVQQEGFRVSRRKLAVMSRGGQQEITGYGTNASRPSIGREYRGRIRAAIHGLTQMAPGSPQYKEELNSIRGRIQHVRKTNPGAARRLTTHLKPIFNSESASPRQKSPFDGGFRGRDFQNRPILVPT